MLLKKDHSIALLLLTWGGVTLALLPLGATLGVRGLPFTLVSLLQLLLFVVAVGAALLRLLESAASCSASRPASVRALLALILLIFVPLLLVEGLHPVTARDALVHHLAVPKLWVASGRIASIPWHEWSFYPMLINLAFTSLEAWGVPELSSLYSLGFLLCSAALAAAITQRLLLGAGWGLIAGLIVFTIPNALSLAASPLVDLGLTLFALLAIERMVHFHATGRLTFAVQAGAALGFLLGTKYNAIPFVISFVLAVPFSFERKSIGQLLRATVPLSTVAVLIFLPWALKNYWWTGNPLYPLYANLFTGTLEPGAVSGLGSLAQRRLLYQESWGAIALTPLRMLFLGRDGDPRYFDGVFSPILAFGLLALVAFRRQPWIRFLVVLVVSYYCFALIGSSWRIRYLAPLFGIVAILAAYGLQLLRPIITSWGIGALLLAQVVYSLRYQYQLVQRSQALPYLRGELDVADYLRQQLREYRVIERVNSELPRDARVYLLQTANAFYYYTVGLFSGGYFSIGPLIAWVRSSNSVDEIAQQFYDRGITHILVHKERGNRGIVAALNDIEEQRFKEFESSYLEPVFQEGEYLCLKVRASTGSENIPLRGAAS